MKNTELLSPAGSIDAARQAVHNGADAIYLGGADFGARAFAANFTYDQMKTAIDFCHLYGTRVFVTVNTLIYQHETAEFLEHVRNIYELGADALIIQDIGMMDAVHQMFPDIDIHASTQMHNHNDACLEFAKSMGACRSVLAREMTLDQIKRLKCSIEKEVFIHGALCICYSGQCLFSALTLNRSGNRGKCAQSCRMKYTLLDEDEEEYKTGYLLSPKDIGLFEDVEKLKSIGIDCLKMEGRMKPPEYVGLITKIYRALLDGKGLQKCDLDNLRKLFNRGFTKGHLLQIDALMNTKRPNHTGVTLGKVASVSKSRITIKLSNELNQGDGIKFERTDTGFICNKIYKNGKLVNSASEGETIELDNKAQASKGDSVVKTSDTALIRALGSYTTRKIPVTAKLTAKIDKPLELELTDGSNIVKTTGAVVEQSRTAPCKGLEDSIAKLGDTPFDLTDIDVNRDENIFVAKSAVNALRRSATNALLQKRTYIPERKTSELKHRKPKRMTQTEPAIHVLVRNEEQLEAIAELPIGDIYTIDANLYGKHPNVRLKTDRLAKEVKPLCKMRLLITDNGGLYEYHTDNDFVLDYTTNAINSYTLALFAEMGAKRIAVSPELELLNIKEIMKAYEQQYGDSPVLESLVYGRYELMAMQHCVIADSLKKQKHCGLCKQQRYYLSDIKGNRFPVVCDSNCNSYILHHQCEHRKLKPYFDAGVKNYRIELLNETPEQAKHIVSSYLKQLNSL